MKIIITNNRPGWHRLAPLYIIIIVVIMITGCKPSQKKEESPTAKPNILVFLCDDLGYGDLSSYGHPHIQTPNLDQMASGGIRLTSCYSAAPVCSPSRVGLITGRVPNRTGVYDWIPEDKGEQEDYRDLVHMQRDEVTIPQLLKLANYQTCLVGKWHCNSKFNSTQQPQPGHFGFDNWFATQNNASPSHRNPKNFIHNGVAVNELEGYSCQLIVENAIKWLDTKKESAPFYIQVSFHEPHEPVASPPDLVEKYLAVTKNRDEAEYFANVENMDRAVGIMMQALKKRGLEENTLVVFTSDNGPETLNRYARANRSYGSAGLLKGMKLWTHEAGIRVPGILYWPEKIKNGKTLDTPVSSLDLLPTFCQLAGVPLPDRELDGTDISPLFEQGTFERGKPLLWCYYNAINQHRIAMRHGEWKIMARLSLQNKALDKYQNIHSENTALIKQATPSDFLLFKVDNDLGEKEEVSSRYPGELEQMKSLLLQHYDRLIEDSHVWGRN